LTALASLAAFSLLVITLTAEAGRMLGVPWTPLSPLVLALVLGAALWPLRQLPGLCALGPGRAEHLHGLPGGARRASAEPRPRRRPPPARRLRCGPGARGRVRARLRAARGGSGLGHLPGPQRDLLVRCRRGGAGGGRREAAE